MARGFRHINRSGIPHQTIVTEKNHGCETERAVSIIQCHQKLAVGPGENGTPFVPFFATTGATPRMPWASLLRSSFRFRQRPRFLSRSN